MTLIMALELVTDNLLKHKARSEAPQWLKEQVGKIQRALDEKRPGYAAVRMSKGSVSDFNDERA